MTEREQENQRDLETRSGQRSLGTYPRRVKLPKQRVLIFAPPCFQKVGPIHKIKIKTQPKQHHNPNLTQTKSQPSPSNYNHIPKKKTNPNKNSAILTTEIHPKKKGGGKIKERAFGTWAKDGVHVGKIITFLIISFTDLPISF